MNRDSRTMLTDLGLLVARIMLGVVGMYHGAGKLFGAFGGPGISGFAGFLEKMNVPLPKVSAVMAGSAEFFGGLLILIGLLTRVVTLPWIFNFLVAFFVAHHAVFSGEKGGEFALSLAVFALALALTGPGRLSLDNVLFGKKVRA